MKTIFIAIALTLYSSKLFAGYHGSLRIAAIQVHSDGLVLLNVAGNPSGTCSYFAADFKFDMKSAGGPGMLANLYVAKEKGKSIDVWFTDSSKAGTNEHGGCTPKTLATANGFRINF